MRTVAQSAASSWDESVRLLCSLPAFSEWERIEAVAELVRSTSPAIRRRALRLGADVLPDDLLVSWLREPADDVVRNAGLEILKLRGGRAFSLVRQLAFDTDPDVALQAALLIDHYRDPRGVAVLKTLLDHGDTNVVQAAIVGLGHHHDPSVVRNLARFLDADVWLQIAAIQALGDIGDPSALPLLEPLLADEFLETFASEAIAHIGSADSFRTLAAHWRPREASVDGERYLSLLASVMVQLPERFFLDRELEASVVRQLNGPGASLRAAAATLLLASGSITHERASLEVLAQSADASSQLPACLSQRSDLTSLLLERSGVQREWGLQLAARYPGSAAAREVADAVLRGEVPEHLAEACSALAQSSSDAAASAVIAIFGRVEPDRRSVVHPAIARHAARLLQMLPASGLAEGDAVILAALAGMPAGEVVSGVNSLDEATRRAVVPQILVRGDVIEALPWSVWIESDPVRDGDLLAAAVVDANLVTAAPLLREVARISPSLRVVEALGCIGDDASIDLLDSLLTDSDGRMRVFIWNALGRIGGERVRAIFRRAASDLPSGEARFAYRAWAGCAASDDVQHFRSVAGDHDWLVRAAVADVLARYPDPSSSEVLSALALDPVEAVAEKAVAIAVTLDARK